ncbi:MAG: hypothetical protein RLZZ550_1191 [Verrucomicrobiota bacterium]|jgi:hypothetical protein
MNPRGVGLNCPDARPLLKPVPTITMNTHSTLLALALLATSLPCPAHAAEKPAATAPARDDEAAHDRLVAARRQANALPEVAAAHQQAKADRALAQKAQAEYRTANKRATESEDAYRKAFTEALAKVDPEAANLIEKAKAAFRERMAKAREARKAAAPRKPAAREEAEQPDDEDEG